MPDEIKVDAAKFDRILKCIVDSKPLSKAEISARIKVERDAKREQIHKQYKNRRKAKKLGQ